MRRIGVPTATLVAVVVSCAAHVLLGWEWTVLGGFAAGLLAPARPAAVGFLTGLISWTFLVAYNLFYAPEQVNAMLNTMGAIFGGVPGWIVAAVTIALGGVIALAGALPGGIVRRAWLNFKRAAVVQST